MAIKENLLINHINELSSENSDNFIKLNKKKQAYLKSVLFLIFTLTVCLNSNLGIFNINLNKGCLFDLGLSLFKNINVFFQSNARDYLLIFSSFLVDFCIIHTVIYWAIYGKSWRLLFHIVIFYLPRGFVQKYYNMPFPVNYNFSYPGFPSISVPYGRTNDFFWSGHVAIPIICGYEFKSHGHKYLFYFAIFTSLSEWITMLCLSGHYTIDMIFGIIYVLYSLKLVEFFISKVDNSCMKMKDNISHDQ